MGMAETQHRSWSLDNRLQQGAILLFNHSLPSELTLELFSTGPPHGMSLRRMIEEPSQLSVPVIDVARFGQQSCHTLGDNLRQAAKAAPQHCLARAHSFHCRSTQSILRQRGDHHDVNSSIPVRKLSL